VDRLGCGSPLRKAALYRLTHHWMLAPATRILRLK
jgi:hypothetical protein